MAARINTEWVWGNRLHSLRAFCAVCALAFCAAARAEDAAPQSRYSVTVTAEGQSTRLMSPDPGERVIGRSEMLDANAAHPGVPVSIPGLPSESASGGIKAPQYFAPGVAGDHGEPIAQYLQVGSFLVPNNLSANAHGNGYADPNVLVPALIEGVEVDGGAYSVREGNHALAEAASYAFRSHLDPFVTVAADARDVDISAGWKWIAIEAAYGNGLLDTPEHRRQYKLNAFRVFNFKSHELTLFGAGYYGDSKIPGLVPIGVPGLHDTIDPRQRDQTHTGEIAANDIWRLDSATELHNSGFFRTYNLSLYSNFGDGLIRQSEFRTVTGGESDYIHRFGRFLSILAGVNYLRDAPRRLDLDRYDSADPSYYGPFRRVSANNVTLDLVSPYFSIDGNLTHWIHYDLGWRRDQIRFDNADLLNPGNSFVRWVPVNSPKATISFEAPDSSALPNVALSFGQAFFTNDPRVGTGTAQGSPVSRAHAYQLIVSKSVFGTEFRATFGRIAQEQSLAKIDPDTGLQFDEGPSRNRFMTLAARRRFSRGMVEVSFSKADARDVSGGVPVPEAPRMILDVLGALNRLPFGIEARGEYEEVGRKPLGDGFASVPVREFHGALVRSFLRQRLDVGVNFAIARGLTGQTTEVLALPGEGDAFERVVGVRLPSYATMSFTYRFRK